LIQSLTSERSSAAAGKVALVEDSFHHEALFYSGAREFLQATLPFIAQAIDGGEAVLVVVAEARAALLREALGDHAERVRFLGFDELGRNPARLIPAWRKLVEEHAAETGSVRVIDEAVRPGLSAAELEECHRHEALLDEAFAGGPSWRLLCPYDLDSLEAEEIGTARSMHRTLLHEGTSRRNGGFRHRAPGPFEGALPSPPAEREELAFTARGLGAVRALVARNGERAGLPASSREDLVLAVNELVTNSVQYGGGGGTLRVWREPGAVVCEAGDRGLIRDPLVGRVAPPVDQYGGRGLWLANHLCDLVQIRSSLDGTVVRAHMRV
jgi:anti-sigma regulatory factor (Ser/Thr protein kinase)